MGFKPPYKLIREYQLLEAKSLLLQSDKTVKSVALELGFNDSSNFVKFFKKQAGLTPLNYRENLRIYHNAGVMNNQTE